MATFSQTHRIRYDIIRNAVGINYGKNHWDYVDPRKVTTLAGVIGKAGVNLEDYAAFITPDFDDDKEIYVRSTPVKNHMRVYFIDRRLLDIPDRHLLNRWTKP